MHRLAIILVTITGCISELGGTPPTDPPVQPEPEEPPAPITEVRVLIRDAGLGVSGIDVVFQAADDTVIAERVTDATGLATADMPAGGTVTVIRREVDEGETRTTAFTYTGVKPGDLLDLAGPTARGTAPTTVQLTVPTPDPEEGIGAYLVLTPCGVAAGLAPTIEITLDGCGTETDFFVLDNTFGGFLARRPIAPTIDLSSEVVRGNRDTTLIATNAPLDAEVTLQKRLLASHFLLFTSTEVPTNTTTSVPDLGPTVADQLVVARLRGPEGVRRVASRETYNNNTGTIDLGGMELPTIETAVFDGAAVAWVESGPGLRDFAVAKLTDGSIRRVVLGSNVDPGLRIPMLPAGYGIALRPEAEVAVSIGRATGGYDAVRGRLLGGSLLDAAPMNGRIAISALP